MNTDSSQNTCPSLLKIPEVVRDAEPKNTSQCFAMSESDKHSFGVCCGDKEQLLLLREGFSGVTSSRMIRDNSFPNSSHLGTGKVLETVALKGLRGKGDLEMEDKATDGI